MLTRGETVNVACVYAPYTLNSGLGKMNVV